MSAVSIRPLVDLLAEVAEGLRDALLAEWSAILVRAADGRPEIFVTAGSGTDALPSASAAETAAGLAAPVMVRGHAAGTVYLGLPAGHGPVSDHDAAIALTAAVGVAGLVERTRTAEANRRRERWLSGGTEVARALTAAHHSDPLTLIVEHAAEIADADAVMLLTAGVLPGLLHVEAAAGSAAHLARRQLPDTDDGHVRRVLDGGRALRIDDFAAAGSWPDTPVDAVMLAPMHGSAGLRGVLGFGRSGRGGFRDAELGMATMYAGTVALALELAESQSHREQLALVVERDRIARDLHDHVIQRLYAIGLTIQHVTSLVDADVAERLLAGVTDIDAAIAQIRSTIFRLSMPLLNADVSLRARAEALVDELEPVLGYRPTLVSEGPLEFGLDEELMADCEAVLREGITNIARHAQASSADIRIVVGRGAVHNAGRNQVQIEIADNGRGLGETERRSGLGNLRQRAEQYGGTLDIVTNGTTGGTRLVWTVPLDEARR